MVRPNTFRECMIIFTVAAGLLTAPSALAAGEKIRDVTVSADSFPFVVVRLVGLGNAAKQPGDAVLHVEATGTLTYTCTNRTGGFIQGHSHISIQQLEPIAPRVIDKNGSVTLRFTLTPSNHCPNTRNWSVSQQQIDLDALSFDLVIHGEKVIADRSCTVNGTNCAFE